MEVPWDLVTTAIALGLALLLTITTAIRSGGFQLRAKAAKDALYEDKDGAATEESQNAYSVRIQKIVSTLIAVAGFGVALACAVRGTLAGTNVITWWLHFGLLVGLSW